MDTKWNDIEKQAKKTILFYFLTVVLSAILIGISVYIQLDTLTIKASIFLYIVMMINMITAFYYIKFCKETALLYKLEKIDKIPTEILILGISITLLLCFYLIGEAYTISWRYQTWDLSYRQMSLFIAFIGLHFLCFFYGFLFLIVRKQKMGCISRDSKILQLKRILSGKYKKYISQFPFVKQMFIRRMLFFSIIGLGFLFILINSILTYNGNDYIDPRFNICLCLIEGIAIIWYLKNDCIYEDLGDLINFIKKMCKGELITDIACKKESPLYETAVQLADISGNMKRSLDRQIKSEKMKVDLITNVSHDLKTPLTAIIGYIDLLKKEDLTKEAKDYIEVLSNKTDDLKEMIQDLFELAKSTSGNMEVKSEKLDMEKLLLQTLGNMENQILESKRTIKKSFPAEPIYIMADGTILYRVYQNLIENALKYSMEGTRIYIEVEKEEKQVVVTIKNTASYEMNFTEDTITERFIRGDEARSTEGNGLGLTIAKSFTESCGGSLSIIIDGDLFKVTTKFFAV